MKSSSILSEIYENRRSIYKGKDIYFSLFVTIVVSLFILLEVISIQDILIVLSNTVYIIQPLVETLFPTLIGALATIVAFLFAGMIFLVSFHPDDKFIQILNHDNQKPYRIVLFHIRWVAAIGSFGIITSLGTILSLSVCCSLLALLLFMASIFFFVYAISSIFGLFALLASYGKRRLKYHTKQSP